MIRQCIYISKYDWLCMVFYEATPFDTEEISNALEEIGVSDECYHDARILLLSGEMNSGFTYSNTAKGLSVMVITKTTSADEFQDTFDHEKGHLAAHIALAEKVNPWGEEIEYLRGEIGKQTFKKAKYLLCEHCRK